VVVVHCKIVKVYDGLAPVAETSKLISQVWAVPVTMLLGAPTGVYQQIEVDPPESVVLVAEFPIVVLAKKVFADVGQSFGAGFPVAWFVMNHC